MCILSNQPSFPFPPRAFVQFVLLPLVPNCMLPSFLLHCPMYPSTYQSSFSPRAYCPFTGSHSTPFPHVHLVQISILPFPH